MNTPAEAVRALSSQLAGFREYLAGDGRRYRVLVGKGTIGADELLMRSSASEAFTFIPVIGGGKGGVFQTIIGVTLIAVGVFIGQPYLVQAGVALTLGGIAQMIAKSPTSNTDETKNNPSYIFNGGVNTTAQGQPVPVGYGRMRVGSAVISAGIYSSDIPV